MFYLRDSIWSLFFLGVVKHNVKCASVMCLGVLDHGAYCAIVVICVKSRHPQLCFRNVILVLSLTENNPRDSELEHIRKSE